MTDPGPDDAELLDQLGVLDVLREPTSEDIAEAAELDPGEWHSMKEDDS